MELLFLLLSLIGVLPLAAYLVLRVFYSPRIEFRIAGEQLREPIPTPRTDSRYFAVSTRSSRRVELSEVWVAFEPDEVNLSETHGAETRSTLDAKFPLALFFGAKRVVARKLLQANFFDYEAKAGEFEVRFSAVANVDETELPFLLDMFPAKKFRAERIVKFGVRGEAPRNLIDSGLVLKPGEFMSVEGPQAQAAVWAATDIPGTEVRVIENVQEKPTID